MLHQPASTFEPSPVPSGAQPFDAKPYLDRARALGLMVFPVIMPSGSPTYGLVAYPGYSWSKGNERLAKEYSGALNASSDGTAAIFEALCADFGLDPASATFNDEVNAVCRARSRESTDDDVRLIELCKRAKVALERDLAATNLFCDATERFEAVQPERPTYTTVHGDMVREIEDARTMRETLTEAKTEWSRGASDKYRARIAKVVAYEKECERLKREVGFTRAEAAAETAGARAKTLVLDVAELPANTLLGLAYKAALLPLWDKAGYGLDGEGETLAFSIADDARMLGTSEPYEKTARSRQRQPSAQVH